MGNTLNRDKQIEEMAKEIEIIGYCDGSIDFYKTASKLHRKGYHKASEVAREILADKILIDHLERACGAGGKLALARIKELKKEYEVK